MPALQVRFLGHYELLDMGEPLALPATRKAQALLAYLILKRAQPQLREHLAELFWGDRPDEKARRSLSTAVWQICRCLPDRGYILSNQNTVQFNPQASLSLDTDDFEILVSCTELTGLHSAIKIYRGEFLTGSYEDWIIHERYRLENLYLDALARLMSTYEAQSEFKLALETSLRLLSYDALREDAHQTAMRIYCRLGKRNAALEQYQHCKRTVLKELNTEPMLETSQLYQAILDGQIVSQELATTDLRQLEIDTARRQIDTNPLDSSILPPFLGRDVEMERLELAWEQAKAGRSELLLIQGEAGVGKTRLLNEFSNRLQWKGIKVLWGRCFEFERILPYQPIAEALRSASQFLTQYGPDTEKFWIVQEIFRLVPELASAYPKAVSQPVQPADQEQARLFEGVIYFLSDLSQPNGLLMILEDLHWAAESTLELLHYLVRKLAQSPVLILGTMRPEELGRNHPLRIFQSDLKREGLIQDLPVNPLLPADLEAIVSKMSGRGDAILPLAHRLYQETEGNPFFLMETIKSLFENQSICIEGGLWTGDFNQIQTSRFPLPASLSEAVRHRIQRLNDAAREAITIASVIGREFDYTLLKDVWGRDEEQTLQALETLLRRRFVEEGNGLLSRDYVFTHHKLQEIIYSDLPRHRRCQLHAQIGSILERLSSQESYEHAGELAFHFFQSRQLSKEYTEKAIHYLLRAGDQARMIYAQKEASGYYNQALEILKKQGDYERTARVKMKLGVTYHNAFEYELAHQAFEDGFRLWQKVSQFDNPTLLPAPHPLRTNWPPITSIDPAFGMDFAGAITWQLFSGLVAFSLDLEIIPDAAQKWQLYSGGREYVFKLRNDLQWSDGRPFTAYDFEFSGKRMLAPATQSPLACLLFDIKGAHSYRLGELADPDSVGLRAVDTTTLVVELEKPASYFLQLLPNFLAAPQHCIESFGEKWTEPENIVTNGSFRMESWTRNTSILLAKYPHYHGQFTGNIQQVELNLQPDPNANLESYALDKLDVLDLRVYPMVTHEKAVRQFLGEYFSFPSASLGFIGFNVRKFPFQDERVRLAFALAIDKEMLCGATQRGSVFPATGGLIPPGLPGHSPGIGLQYDPIRAKDLLVQAGFHLGRDFPKIEALTPLKQDDPVNKALADQWEEILGVDVVWRAVSPGLHLVLEKTPPDIFLSYWYADYPDPDNFLGANQFLRWTGWQDDAYLRLLEETRLTADQSNRMSMFAMADKLLVEKAAIVPISYQRQRYLLKPWVKRYPTSALYYWFWKDVVIEPH